MDRKKRFEILAQADSATLLPIADEILRAIEVDVLKKPETSLVMLRALDSVTGRPFNVGEVFVTECEVRLGNHVGYSLIMGEEVERALAAAVIDVALESGQGSASSIEESLWQEEQHLQTNRKEEIALIGRTRVNFEIVKG
ncbi:MAG: phosphonate C-P lyase system protein PhnG [Candidatus Binatia bacterium]